MNTELAVGDYLRIQKYNNRNVITTTKYIIITPIKNDHIHGMVVAFHVHTGTMAWSCNYEKSLATGMYKVYNKKGELEYAYKYRNPLISLQETATRCAELILN